ncbi:MAG TPA: hypothetical protein VK590_16215 [Saprospiraceae bacterium]|nr:hypothetical protein [Saprospiraceae bacterium]
MSSFTEKCDVLEESFDENSHEFYASEFDNVKSLKDYNYKYRMLELFSDDKDGLKNLEDEMARVKLEIGKKERDADLLRVHYRLLCEAKNIAQSEYPYFVQDNKMYPKHL